MQTTCVQAVKYCLGVSRSEQFAIGSNIRHRVAYHDRYRFNYAQQKALFCRTFSTKIEPTTQSNNATDLGTFRDTIESQRKQLCRQPSAEQGIPEEQEMLEVLQGYQKIVNKLAIPTSKHGSSEESATSSILTSMNKSNTSSQVTPSNILDQISMNASDIISHPNIFITPSILKLYITLQSRLSRPADFPNMFHLYSHKPRPQSTSTPPFINFTSSNPNSPSSAIPPGIAETALTAAISSHSLPLCLSVIDRTYCTRSYARYKSIRSALIPVTGAVLAPLAAYTLANKASLLQTTMDQSYATGMYMAGILTYLLTVGSMGYVTATTANDQMVRVTWMKGMPLWERWIREEERAAVDKVAQAWGFQDPLKWGDEEGEDWGLLREWAGVRGMLLDRVESMQGME